MSDASSLEPPHTGGAQAPVPHGEGSVGSPVIQEHRAGTGAPPAHERFSRDRSGPSQQQVPLDPHILTRAQKIGAVALMAIAAWLVLILIGYGLIWLLIRVIALTLG